MSKSLTSEILDEVEQLGTYGLEEHILRRGGGDNRLRTESFAQPRALREGDILACGDRVLATPREGYNGNVWVLLSGGLEGHWISMAARLPIALLVDMESVPEGFVK